MLLGGLALGDLSTHSLALGRAVFLLRLGADFLDVRQVGTNDGTLDLRGADGTALGYAVSGRLAVDAAVRAGPRNEAGVLLVHVQAEALWAVERQHGLR